MQPLFYKPHPALSGLVNNIMISHVKTPSTQKKLSFPSPHCQNIVYSFIRLINQLMKL